MKHASRLLLLALFVTTSISGKAQKRTLDDVYANGKDAAPALIDWSIEQVNKYPAIPGLATAAALKMAKETLFLKRTSFLAWAAIGLIAAEPYRFFSQTYLQLKKAQESKEKQVVTPIEEPKKTIMEQGKEGLAAIGSTVQKTSKEIYENASQAFDNFTSANDRK